MDLASIAFISTYKSWHYVISIKTTLKKYCYQKFNCKKTKASGQSNTLTGPNNYLSSFE